MRILSLSSKKKKKSKLHLVANKQYTIKGKRGIDDLKGIYAFVGNSQGDTSESNEISDYIASRGWMSFIFDGIDITNQEAIYQESGRRLKDNLDYIEGLHREGRFGEEFESTISLVHNPLYDEPSDFAKGFPLTSYKMVFLDLD
jgi:hypothetical protein